MIRPNLLSAELSFVIGLVLSLVGRSRAAYNSPISDSDAIQNAARITRGPDGKQMYNITGAEIHQARHRAQATNNTRAQARQSGKALALPGVIMLAIGLIGFGVIRSKNEDSGSECEN